MYLQHYSLEQLARGLRTNEFSACALLEACLDSYAASEQELNAYKSWNGERMLAVAEQADKLLKLDYDLGPLMGLPVSVKDMFGVPGLPTFAGSSTRLGPEWEQAGPLVLALLRQLAVITGKTHTVEFALGGIGINAHWGTPKNPWSPDQHRVPGGSSSGAGISLCQGSALLALGTDTGGSVRIPAAMTGTVGFKPATGRWPTEHVVPLSSSLDSPGVLTRTVADAVFVYEAIQSCLQVTSVTLPLLSSCRGLRIGVVENFFWEDAADDLVDVVRQAMNKLEQAGAILVPVQVADCEPLFAMFQQGGLSVAELSAFLSSNMSERLEQLDPVVRSRIIAGGGVSASEYLQRKESLRKAGERVAQLFAEVDFWLHPTLPISAPTVAQLQDPDEYRRYNMLALRNPCMANLLGLCALSIPAGLDRQGLPVAIQLSAPAHHEPRLLAAGAAVENVLGTLFKQFY